MDEASPVITFEYAQRAILPLFKTNNVFVVESQSPFFVAGGGGFGGGGGLKFFGGSGFAPRPFVTNLSAGRSGGGGFEAFLPILVFLGFFKKFNPLYIFNVYQNIAAATNPGNKNNKSSIKSGISAIVSVSSLLARQRRLTLDPPYGFEYFPNYSHFCRDRNTSKH